MGSNYAKLCEDWRLRFLAMDQARLLAMLPGLSQTEEWLTLRHFGRLYGVSRSGGQIVTLPERIPADSLAALNIYTLFGFVRPGAVLQGDWVGFERLRDTAPFSAAFRRGILEPLARSFTGHLEALASALAALGGAPLGQADLSYQVPAFDCIPLRLLFWEGDEEFPAQANLLFDRSATDFIHGESIVSIAMLLLRLLAGHAGLPLDRAALASM